MTRREFLVGCVTAAVAAAASPVDVFAGALGGAVEPYNPSDYPWTYPASVRVRFSHPFRTGEWTHVAFSVDRSRLVGLWINGVDYTRDRRALAYIERWLKVPAVANDTGLFEIVESDLEIAEGAFRIEMLLPSTREPLAEWWR
jgi:hypothetical protein